MGDLKIDKDRFLDILAIFGSDMNKWPGDLRRDMEEVFQASPELLDILNEEKEFEDMINQGNLSEKSDGSSDESINS